ncbi:MULTISPECIES: hypothetical protein [unclassified Chelatococcus]|uniref:hypothetical protein n=1 Tax=unclassified Chelatococcus TaxID=2638111 RepID=UPI001BCEEBE6|nr:MULTISPECIES: hypothetical protein [unclassified Chelatococcus]MBS7740027.1 hypothetical protein [Chelatococcus sp. HY11]MBX3545144.1 hypothetical protein [Chelatococcus sp.]MCO5078673.1 hypothetical protein [Chelatococcus sp.]
MTSLLLPTDRPLPRPNVHVDHILLGVAILTETAKAVLVAAYVPAGASMAVFIAIDLGATFATTAIAHFAMNRYDRTLEWPEPAAGVGCKTILWGLAAGLVDSLVTALGAGYTYLVGAPDLASRCSVAGIVGCCSTGIRAGLNGGLRSLGRWVPGTSTPAYAEL